MVEPLTASASTRSLASGRQGVSAPVVASSAATLLRGCHWLPMLVKSPATQTTDPPAASDSTVLFGFGSQPESAPVAGLSAAKKLPHTYTVGPITPNA